MKIEVREHWITLVPETNFERNALEKLKHHSIKNMNFENAWEGKGKFLIEYDDGWD